MSIGQKTTFKLILFISGDLFECAEDLEDYTLWQENSENPELQQQHRMEVLQGSDYIIPGHGPMFKVPDDSKRQLRMVMFQERTVVDGPSGSSTKVEMNYVVLEED